MSDSPPNVPEGAGDQAEAGPSPVPRPSIRDLEELILRYNSDLDRYSLTFKAALILLASTEYGHNIEVLARRTGLDRSLVARVARRLIDNGVWTGGVTLADWTRDEASGAFWNDVAVAEGKMCRRIGPSGQTEWAPAGFWNKNFQFVDPDQEKSLAARYLDAGPPDGEDETVHEAAAEPVAASHPAGPPETPVTDVPERLLETEVIGPLPGPRATVSPSRKPATVPRLDDLFDNVVWIG